MEQKKRNPIQRIWDLAKKEHGLLKKSIALSVIAVIVGFLPYLCAAKIITLLVEGKADAGQIILCVLAAFAANEAKTLFAAWSTSVSHRATFAVLARIRHNALKKLANLSLVTLPLGMLFMMSTMVGYAKNYEKSLAVGKKMNDSILDYIGGIKVIKAFNQSDATYTRYADSIMENASFYYGWMKRSQLGMSCALCISPAVLVTVIPFGLLFYMNGSITITKFLTVLVLAMSVVPLIIKTMQYIDSLATMETMLESVEELFEMPEQHHPEEKVELYDRTIELQNVTFAYEKEKGNVLSDVNLKIYPGTKTALVGPSGGGKSTIAKLIACFWDVEEGSISLGGKNLKEIPLWQIAEQISYVSQDNFLFDDTVRNNIRIGKKDATDQEVEEIAKLAGCDSFIRKLDHGYETNVGSGGAHLSGGERQRIAIARAMLKDAPIVILDETTAYIDSENEAVIQEPIEKPVKGKTLIVIAHRLVTVTNSDQIVLVENGEIRAVGTHEELLGSNALYQHMWSVGSYGEREGKTA